MAQCLQQMMLRDLEEIVLSTKAFTTASCMHYKTVTQLSLDSINTSLALPTALLNCLYEVLFWSQHISNDVIVIISMHWCVQLYEAVHDQQPILCKLRRLPDIGFVEIYTQITFVRIAGSGITMIDCS